MEKLVSKVTRKGQVTIPAQFRKRHRIAEGSYVEVTDDEKRILIQPIPNLLDLAGVDTGKFKLEQLKRELDRSRQKWR